MKFISTIKIFVFSPFGAIMGLSFVAYAVLSPWLGFYWDDWSLMWLSHEFGSTSLQGLSNYHVRPLAGWVLWAGAELFGDQAFFWHLFAWVLRLGGGLLMYWFGKLLWPNAKRAIVFVALVFVLYPGYRHQLVSVNTSYHFVSMLLFLLSISLMVLAVRRKERSIIYTIGAVLLALASMLTSEYIYGLELVRPLIIFLALYKVGGQPRYKETILRWLPFLALLLGVYLWRYSLADQLNYPVLIIEDIKSEGIVTLWSYASRAIGDLIDVTFFSWLSAFAWPDPATFGIRSIALLLLVVLFSFFYLYYIFRQLHKEEDADRRTSLEFLALGIVAIAAAGIPFWVTKLDIKVVFAADRFILPMMFGATFLSVGIVESLFAKRKNLLIIVSSLLLSFSMAFHLQNAVAFYRDWQNFQSFITQLQWRAPHLEENTTLFSPELPISFSTDDSIAAALNWGYGQPLDDGRMRLNLIYIDLRYLDLPGDIENLETISSEYLFFLFEGSGEDIVILDFNPPSCLRVYHPVYDQLNPQLAPELRDIFIYSRPDLISGTATQITPLPQTLFESAPQNSWCSYFQKADLARQLGEWEEVVRLGDEAFELDDSPNHAAERFPFIEGYARLGDLERAAELGTEAIRINPGTQPAICLIWERVQDEAQLTADDMENTFEIINRLDCE